MKASTNWIFDLCPALREKGVTAEKLAHKFAHAGIAVDGVHKYGEGAEACVLAQVVSMKPHPSRAQLRLVTVDVGGGKTQEVVCGAPNVPDAGGLVVLAPLGAYLPAKKMKIEPRAIGGVTSEGMLCSELELGLTDDGEGILVFAPGVAKPGTKFTDAIPGASDTIFELDLTPNRPDALGHIGLAREAAALFEIDWQPETSSKSIFGKDGLDGITVEIKDAERCAHYGAALVRDVKIAPSPLSIRYRLASLGVRSISNVVDITNIAMLLSGHPMHAFDLSRVRGNKIVVRRAVAGETFKTLDNVDRTLDADDLVIADGEGAVALAGVMGGANSEIGNDTKSVLFECAYFDPRGVRRASRRHGLHTESSHRFERGVDPSDTESVLADAVAMTLGDGGKADGWKIFTARNIEKISVKLRHQKLEALTGTQISIPQAKDVLLRLGFDVTKSDAASLEAVVPLHRPDVSREVDLIEEVARVRGYDKIKEELPPIRSTRGAHTHETREDLLRRARAAAVALGLSEAVPLSFVDPHAHEIFGAPAPAVTIKNPLSELQSVMRTSLLPGLAAAVARAAKHGERSSRIFAAGPIFLGDPHAAARVLPEERVVLGAILSGERPAYLAKPEGVDTYDAKGVALGFVERFARVNADVRRFAAREAPKHLHPRGAAAVVVHGKIVGSFGPLHPDVIAALELPSPCVVAEIDIAALVASGAKPPSFVAFSRFPAATRDVALVVADAVLAGDVEAVLREAAGSLAERVELFDRFRGGALPAGHSSLAFHVVYRSREKTLTDVEIDTQHAKVVEAAKAKFGATLRSL